MDTIALTLTNMANGGAAMGRDAADRVVFVPFAIPGEEVRVDIVEDRKRFARGQLREIVEPSPDRVEPLCPHFGPCGGCHFQHIDYPAQLRFKEEVVRDQLKRIGGFEEITVKPVLANPEPWAYAADITFSPTSKGQLGFWSPVHSQVIPISTCLIIRQRLLEAYQDIDLELANLWSLTLRLGDDGSLLAALEVEAMEAPSLETDFPISVALILPDGSAANLIGDNYIVRFLKGRDFRVSAGSFFYPSPAALERVVDAILGYAALEGDEKLLELYSGVGTLTAFLAPKTTTTTAIEVNSDAVADAALNLDNLENVTLYEGLVEEILPLLDLEPDVMVVDPPPAGLPPTVIDEIAVKASRKLIYISSDVATMARDGRRLAAKGYRLAEVQPVDMYPQNYQVLTVSCWLHQA
jgi:23S rRNA (uracil1939-C5)-methyltransferase